MRRLTLDYKRETRARGAGYVLLLLGCGIMALLASHYRSVTQDLESQRASMQRAQIEPRETTAADTRAAKDLDARMQAAHAVMDQLSIPWDGLFRALESVDQMDVALLAVSPDAAKRQIKLSGEAKTLAAMLAYHRNLAKSPAFSQVSLTNHDVVQQDPQRPVRFSATATWVLANNARK
jgi:Tfp pilus assembly protein PilN